MKRWFAAVGFVLAASPAFSQTIEVTPFASFGQTTTADIDKKAPGVQDLAISGGFTWGAQAGYFFSERVGVEVLWTQQLTDLKLSTSSGSASLFDLKVRLLHGDFVYQFLNRGARWQPFVFAGLGATFFSAEDLDSETKLSWAMGGGVKWFPLAHVGVRAHARYKPTHLDAASSGYCDPFGFCQGWLNQFDFAGGLALRF
jgi:opacity protein-like surface antigen